MDRSTVIPPTPSTTEAFATKKVSRQVRGRWVPGTSDQLELRLLETDECAQVSVRWFLSHFGRAAMDSLYLRGKYEFECDDGTWKRVKNAREHA